MASTPDSSLAPSPVETASEPEVAPRPAAPAGPAAIVLLGATGDLTKRQLFPALYHLAKEGLLPERTAVIGVGRTKLTDEAFRARLSEEASPLVPGTLDRRVWDALLSRVVYVSGDFSDPALYGRLRHRLDEVEREHGTGGNALFYLSTSPEHFGPITAALAADGLTQENEHRWRRVVVEKPFGTSLESARRLNAQLRAAVRERQIYRIDHYLGKETVQNLLVLRFANGIFEPVWNRRYVDHVQISVAETLGVEKRGGYYDAAGALRDMVPNHIFQLITLVAMEPPISFEADAVRDEQTKVVRAMTPFTPEDVLKRTVRGQYGAGTVNGEPVVAYRAEPGVAPDSNTETYVAMKLAVDSWRWNGVPFYLRVGKALAQRSTRIVIQFRQPPLVLFRSAGVTSLQPNRLVIRIQPEEGIGLMLGAKLPGPTVKVAGVEMSFRYADAFGDHPSTGYERLLYDALMGDPTLFQRADMAEAAWAIVDPILDVWSALPERRFPNYRAGSMGPAEADALLAQDGRTRWTARTT